MEQRGTALLSVGLVSSGPCVECVCMVHRSFNGMMNVLDGSKGLSVSLSEFMFK